MVENKAGQSKWNYGSWGHAPPRVDDRHAGCTIQKSGRAKYNRPDPFELRRDVARHRGAAHPLCFTNEVMDHEFPEGFKPVNVVSYDGTTDPAVWIEDFLLQIHIACGDDLHAIKYLPLKLKGPARHWLNSLPANSIGSWENLADAFLDNFQGTYVRPLDADDLSHITQQPGEPARKFWTRFLTKKNQIVDYPDAEALAAFKHNICDEWLARNLGQEKPKSMAALTTLMTRFCAGEVSWLARSNNTASNTGKSEAIDSNGTPRRNKHKCRKHGEIVEDMAVNAGFNSSKSGQRKGPLKNDNSGPSSLDRILDRPCQIHGRPGIPANHTNREFWVYKQAGRLGAKNKDKGPQSDDSDEEPRSPNRGG